MFFFFYVCFNASNPNIIIKLRNLIWLDCSYEVCKIILKAVRGRESLNASESCVS